MAIIIRVYAGWEAANDNQPDWVHAFPDSTPPNDIAIELFNREQNNVNPDFRRDFAWFVETVQDATAKNFSMLDQFPPGGQPGRLVEIELASNQYRP
jgi:hypothetical protein